jgi:hypothetical protein
MARSYPGIPAFIIGHMGRKWLMPEAMMVAKRTPNVFLETSDTIVEEVYTVVHGSGAQNVLYATNSQFFLDEMAEHIQRHKRVIDDPADLELVMNANALKILGARQK